MVRVVMGFHHHVLVVQIAVDTRHINILWWRYYALYLAHDNHIFITIRWHIIFCTNYCMPPKVYGIALTRVILLHGYKPHFGIKYDNFTTMILCYLWVFIVITPSLWHSTDLADVTSMVLCFMWVFIVAIPVTSVLPCDLIYQYTVPANGKVGV